MGSRKRFVLLLLVLRIVIIKGGVLGARDASTERGGYKFASRRLGICISSSRAGGRLVCPLFSLLCSLVRRLLIASVESAQSAVRIG